MTYRSPKDTLRLIYLIAAVATLAICAAVLLGGNRDAMTACTERLSIDTCTYSLR
jgi:hypothetical protein